MTTCPYCPRPPGLPHELAFYLLRALSDRLPVGHLRTPDIGLHAELTPKPIHDDLKMKLTHTADDRLARLFVGVNSEGRIFIGQLDEPDGEFVLVDPGLRFDGYRDHGLRKVHRFENDRVVRMADRVARLDVLETDDRRDITREHLVPLLPFVPHASGATARPAPSGPSMR